MELYKTLSSSICESGLNGHKFIPNHILNEKVTNEAIKKELKRALPGVISKGYLADRVVKREAKKLFVVLVCLSKPWDIKKLLDNGFVDKDLPLILSDKKLLSTQDSRKIFSPPNSWDYATVDLFIEKQWIVLAPSFSITGEHMDLDRRCPLPFSKDKDVDIANGPNSVVHKMTIDRSHQDGFEVSVIFLPYLIPQHTKVRKAETPRLQIALKLIHRTKVMPSPEDSHALQTLFQREQENLMTIRTLKNNVHITQNLATFSQQNQDYIIFPWAEGGDLENFWEKEHSKPQKQQVTLWSLQQMLGLTEALHALHKEIDKEAHFRHGDLKPGNILHFYTGGSIGTLKIADFGISRIHNKETFERNGSTKTKATTPSYEAPEASEALPEKGARSRKYDIWSLGCIFLEFTIWLLHGFDRVRKFRALRAGQSFSNNNLEHFYQIMGGVAQVHAEVGKMIANLKRAPESKTGTALGDLLDVIQTDVLVVEVQNRYNAEQLRGRLREIVTKAEKYSTYVLGC